MARPTTFREAMEHALAGVAPRAEVLDQTGSTNEDARALAREGAPHGTVVVADVQTAGRGRLGRSWAAEPGTSLLASVVLRPTLPPERWTVVPLVAGVAAVRAVRHRTRVPTRLKWPNDLVVGERKLAGILAEADPPGSIVVGIGVNVSQTSFPPDVAATATSVAIEEGVRLDRADLLVWFLRYLEEALGDPDAALAFYRKECATIGARVRVERANAEPVEGVARDLDRSGALVVETPTGTLAVASGDVVHLRPALAVRPLPPEGAAR